MTKAYTRLLPAFALGALLAGCASDDLGGMFSTASIAPAAPAAPAAAAAPAAPRVDTACLQLAGQIDQLKKDGTIEKLEKVAAGKTTSVQVKRAAIAKQAELNKAYADFQTRCGPKVPAQTAQAQPAAPAAQTASTQPAAPAAGTPAAN